MIVNLLMASALVWTVVQSNECSSNEKKIYVLSDKGAVATWTEALGECGRRGMSLATIKSDEEFKNFMDLLVVSGRPTTQHYWLGGACEGACAPGNKNVWYWITDSTKLASNDAVNNNWIPGQPDFFNGNQQVLAVRADGRNWDDLGYAGELDGWVCQKCVRKTTSSSEGAL